MNRVTIKKFWEGQHNNNNNYEIYNIKCIFLRPMQSTDTVVRQAGLEVPTVFNGMSIIICLNLLF